jgi:hypothetical protein
MNQIDELPDFESTEEDMDAWCERWDFEGYELVCRYCSAGQWPDASRTPFVHRPGCAVDTGTIDLPWRDLSAIFRKACRRCDEPGADAARP